jgi:hypothetical protein
MELTDKIIEELHAWNSFHRAKPNRVIVHRDTFELMLREKRHAHPPLLHQDGDDQWVVKGVPVYCSEQVELGAILIE